VTGLDPARPALDGVRVVDLTRLLPGNYATLLLRGLGAEVIKVEELHGDGTRLNPPFTDSGESGSHIVLNRGKRSVALNLKAEAGREVFLRLLATADVLIDSFRPGVLQRLGLGPDVLAQTKPTLVHVSLNAYGEGGPMQQVPAHDLNAQALAGILSQSVDDQGRPSMPAVPMADMATGLQAALAVLSGLRAVGTDGRGFRAQVAMLDSAMSLTALAAGHLAVPGSTPKSRDLLTGALACYSIYECADGHWLAVGALEPKFFERLCALLERPELVELQYQVDRQDELRAHLAEVFGSRPQAHWTDLLVSEDTCVTPVTDLPEAFTLPDPQARGVLGTAQGAGGQTVPVVAAVPWLPDADNLAAALLGADSREVLAELGFASEQFLNLREQGIVGGGS